MAGHHTAGHAHTDHPRSDGPQDISKTDAANPAGVQPDEDWSKITDLTERRRIQNRIAQRTYRKKLKSRMDVSDKKESALAAPEPSVTAQEVRARRVSRHSRASSTTWPPLEVLAPSPSLKVLAPSTRSPSLELLATSSSVGEETLLHEAMASFMVPSAASFPHPGDLITTHTSTVQEMPAFSYPTPDYWVDYRGPNHNFDDSWNSDELSQVKADSLVNDSISSPDHHLPMPTMSTMDCDDSELFRASVLSDMYDVSEGVSPAELGGFCLTPALMPLSPQFLAFEL